MARWIHQAKKTPLGSGVFLFTVVLRSGGGYVGRLGSLGTVFRIERHFLAFGPYLEALSLDGGEVHKHVLATVGRRDEAESLGLVEPLYSTCRHFDLPLKQ